MPAYANNFSGSNITNGASTYISGQYISSFSNPVIFEDGHNTYLEEENEYSSQPLHHAARYPRQPYTETIYTNNKTKQIQAIYIIAVIAWIILIIFCQFFEVDILGIFILVIPIIIFGINFSNVKYITRDVEDDMLKGNFLSFAFLVAIILINWSKIEDKTKYFKILILALILLMLSLVDVWVDPENMALCRHLRTIFHTTSITLLVFALYMYYYEVVKNS